MRDMSPSDLAEEPAGTTDNPYIRRPGPKRGRDEVNGVFFEQQEKRQRGPHQQGERGGQGKGGDGRPPPEGYVCRICSLPGHFIQDCPTKPQRDQAPKPPPDGRLVALVRVFHGSHYHALYKATSVMCASSLVTTFANARNAPISMQANRDRRATKRAVARLNKRRSSVGRNEACAPTQMR